MSVGEGKTGEAADRVRSGLAREAQGFPLIIHNLLNYIISYR